MRNPRVNSEWIEGGVLRYFDPSTHETIRVEAPVWFADDFVADTASTDNWASTGVNSGTAAINAAANGTIRLTTGDADNDDVDLAGEIVWNTGKYAGCEAKITVTDISGCAVNFGFSDAKTEAADAIAMMLSTGTTAISAASDGALFVWDPDAATDYIYGATVSNDTDGTLVSSATAWVDAASHILRIQFDGDNYAHFYVDGAFIGKSSAAVRTTNNLCLYAAMINRETTANTVDIDYIKAWQLR